ncbi:MULTISPECIES: TRIC cation channel family protein [Desulfovibrio]|uniref:Uncharacterized membrane protein YeiH n=1 Tax=Desulfovibrio desulfuricans TaxID=876 RepID=A0AA94HT58_DESDE|nr:MULTISPECIES: TRIC cation channel family protein [Desulfovibrio]ATD80722.1 hypothetical protein CNY67_04285 [Desulfovibrio sp. G11]SFW52188.1 Uncharacterized membrane protein YeiH [Desulfovibrio desulfuricans]SPD36247.1 Protein of unknown function (UPF0126) [Desulfovibrio sp. G11]
MMQDPLLYVFDLAASFMLAAAASCRARNGGAHFSGAAVLACLAGLAAPLLRDALLGHPVLALNRGDYLAAAVAGAVAGTLAARLGHAWRAFYWLDSMGLGLAAGVGGVRGAVFGLGVVGCLVLGVLAALAGGLVRDVALGDTARLVEEDSYATAAALGVMLALMALLYGGMPLWMCALACCGLVLVLRALRLRKGLQGGI